MKRNQARVLSFATKRGVLLSMILGVSVLGTGCGSKFNGTWDADEITCNSTAAGTLYSGGNRFTLIVDGDEGEVEMETQGGACEKSINAFFDYFDDDEVDIIVDGTWDCEGTCTADTDCVNGTDYNNVRIGSYNWERDGDDLTLTSESTLDYMCSTVGGAPPGRYEFRKID